MIEVTGVAPLWESATLNFSNLYLENRLHRTVSICRFLLHGQGTSLGDQKTSLTTSGWGFRSHAHLQGSVLDSLP